MPFERPCALGWTATSFGMRIESWRPGHKLHCSARGYIRSRWVEGGHVQLKAPDVLHLRPHHRTRSPSTPQFSCRWSGSQSSAVRAWLASRSPHTPTQDITRHSHRLARLSGPSAAPSERADGHPAHPHRQSGILTAGERDKKKTCGAERHLAVEARGVCPTADRDASLVPDPVPPPPRARQKRPRPAVRT